jgi:hypothetical protein
LAYASLWIALLISLAVYAVDVFTAYQLLAFNKWSSQIEPTQLIPFDISKWIFTVCIILSFANLAYEYFRAITIMRGGSVAECFLDSLAARLESIRMGKGRGYKRFLVFAELTKSKKGAEYIALFTFFSFQSKAPVVYRLWAFANSPDSLDPHPSFVWAPSSHQWIHPLLGIRCEASYQRSQL